MLTTITTTHTATIMEAATTGVIMEVITMEGIMEGTVATTPTDKMEVGTTKVVIGTATTMMRVGMQVIALFLEASSLYQYHFSLPLQIGDECLGMESQSLVRIADA